MNIIRSNKILSSKLFSWIAFFAAYIILFGLAVIIVSAAICDSTAERIVSKDSFADDIEFDCILVLGAGVKPDGTPSDMLYDRLITAYNLYASGVSKKIIVSGDHRYDDYNEVGTMKRVLIELGVDSEDVFMDHAGLSTYESVFRAKNIFCAESFVIVTQKYHLSRAIYISEKLGARACGVSADVRTYRGQSYRDLREIVARFKDFLLVQVEAKPTFMGEIISVSGNGDITNDGDISE